MLKAPSGGSGEGTASSSCTGRRVADETCQRAGRARPAPGRRRRRCGGPGPRCRGARARRRSTALPKRRPRSTAGSAISASSLEHRGEAWPVGSARKANGRAVGEVGRVDAVRAQHPLRRPGVGEEVRCAGTREPPKTSAIEHIRRVRRGRLEPGAGVRARARRCRAPVGQRQMLVDQRQQRRGRPRPRPAASRAGSPPHSGAG